MNRPRGKWPVGKPISLESRVDLYILDERGLHFDGLGEPRGPNWTRGGLIFNVLGSLGHSRAASGTFGEPRRTVDDDDSPGNHHHPTPSLPGRKYVVRPGSSLRWGGQGGADPRGFTAPQTTICKHFRDPQRVLRPPGSPCTLS